MKLPKLIQGGMGVAISDWRLAKAVSSLGQLGVVSGTGISRVVASRLTDKQFIGIPEVIGLANVAARRESIWLGRGFHWTDIEASRMHSLIGRGIAAQMGKELLHKDGAYWLHGLAREGDIHVDLDSLVGHTLIVGTTRVGKTRLLELLNAQPIARREPDIIIDPKRDHALPENARRV